MTSTHHPTGSSLRGAQRVRSSIEIDARPEEVWSVVTDPGVFPEAIDWVSEAWTEDEGPLDEGRVYFERGKPGLREGTYRWEVTACEPPHRTVHYHESGELEAELELVLEPIDDGKTRYTQILHFRAFPAFRPLGYVLERTVMRRGMQRDFDETILPNFKRIVESRAATA
jgi:uncharacterized protein YndB with AHSA1/START domain